MIASDSTLVGWQDLLLFEVLVDLNGGLVLQHPCTQVGIPQGRELTCNEAMG